MWQNPFNPWDVNADGFVTASDAAMVVSELNANGARSLPGATATAGAEGEAHRFFDVNGDGSLTSLDAALLVQFLNNGEGEAGMAVQFTLETTDLMGAPVTAVPLGSTFNLNVYVQDMRTGVAPTDLGVFAAYLDVTFNGGLASVVPELPANNPFGLNFDIDFDPVYQNGPHGDVSTSGLIDDVGAFQTNQMTAVGAGQHLVFNVRLHADNPGIFDFLGASANNSPFFDVVVLEPTVMTISPMNINFGSILNFEIVNGQAPIAVNDGTYSVNEDNTLNVNAATGLLANDTDPDLDPLTAVKLTDPAHGMVTVNGDGSFTYTPNADYFGPDSFTYRAFDGTLSSNAATVTINVIAQPDAPRTMPDSYMVNEKTTLTVNAALGVLANDFDPDGTSIIAILNTSPSNGMLVSFQADGSFVYTPNSTFIGTDTFTYVASDGGLMSAPTTVTIQVIDVNDSPVAVDDTYMVNEDSSLVVSAALGVLANDTDAENNPLTAIKVSNPTHGTVSLNSNGSFTYTPNPNFFGPDSFTYQANDGFSNSNLATVTINVQGQPDAPIAVNDSYQVQQDTVLVVNAAQGVLANDTDPDLDSLTANLVTTTTNGQLVFSSNGSFTYTPNSGFLGFDTFTYTATDGTFTSNTATVTIGVGNLTPGSISGYVYADVNNNGIKDNGERGVGGVTIQLTGTTVLNVQVSLTTVSDGDGYYLFPALTTGNYQIHEVQPQFLNNGQNSVQSPIGSVGANDTINILLQPGQNSSGNIFSDQFGEFGLQSSFVNVFNFLASTPSKGIWAALDSSGNQLWFAFDRNGWSNYIQAHVSLSPDGSLATLTVTDRQGGVFETTIFTNDPNHFRILGQNGGGMVLRIDGAFNELGLLPVGSGEGEAPASYASAVDAVFAGE